MKKKVAVIENGLLATYTIRAALMQRLQDEGFDVYVITAPNNMLPTVEKMGIHVIDVGTSGQNPVGVFKYIWRVYHALRELRPDICLTYTIRPAIWGNLVTGILKIPTLTNITGIGPLFESNSIAYRVARLMYRFVLKNPKKIFFQNNDDMNLFLEKKFTTKDKTVRIPGSGVDHQLYAPMEVNTANDKFQFLFISRLIKDKGIIEYVEASRLLKAKNLPVKFSVLGPLWSQNTKQMNVSREELDGWISEGLIDYLGETGDVKPYIAHADCIVLPSYREGTSNVLLEASSMAKPCITTDATGCREIVEHNVTGFLCRVKDGADLAEKMEAMYHLPPERKKEMGRAGREKVIREFDKKIVINAYLDNINQYTQYREIKPKAVIKSVGEKEVVSPVEEKALSTISIDWEDFGQLFGKYHFKTITPPHPAIERQTNIILDILDETNVKATFFVLGMLAQYRPDLVKKIAAAGHEIALHGQNHVPMYTLTREEAYKDVSESKKLVEDIIGDKIYGYRAPFFSLNESNYYLLEMLADLGMEYDSSIFPIKLRRYGISGFDRENRLYSLPNGKCIVELPMSYGTYFDQKVPISGGGYMRLMPKPLVRKVYKDLQKQGIPSMIYMHPYEFDSEWINVSANYPEGADYSSLKVMALNLKWNLFRNSIRDKIRILGKELNFATCKKKSEYVKKHTHCPGVLGRSQ